MPFDPTPDAKLTEALDLRAAHAKQIEALTMPGLSDKERIERFAEAAGFDNDARKHAAQRVKHRSNASAVWWFGSPSESLFADLPGCQCPVLERAHNHANWSDIPLNIPADWQPTAAELWPFSRVQIYARTGLEI